MLNDLTKEDPQAIMKVAAMPFQEFQEKALDNMQKIMPELQEMGIQGVKDASMFLQLVQEVAQMMVQTKENKTLGMLGIGPGSSGGASAGNPSQSPMQPQGEEGMMMGGM
jgi:hypothetical protein